MSEPGVLLQWEDLSGLHNDAEQEVNDTFE
eukprot:gene10859-biopygen4392